MSDAWRFICKILGIGGHGQQVADFSDVEASLIGQRQAARELVQSARRDFFDSHRAERTSQSSIRAADEAIAILRGIGKS